MKTNLKHKSILIFLTAALLVSCSNISDYDRFGLNGKVKSFHEQYYTPEYESGDWYRGQINFSGHHRVTFDQEGQYKYVEYLDFQGNLSNRFVPRYEKGVVVEEDYFDATGGLVNKTKINHVSKEEIKFESFDPDGNLVGKGTTCLANNRVARQVYTVLSSETVIDEFTTVFEYNEDGELLSQKQTNREGEVSFMRKFEYLEFDNQKNWTIRIDWVGDSDEPESYVTRTYEYH